MKFDKGRLEGAADRAGPCLASCKLMLSERLRRSILVCALVTPEFCIEDSENRRDFAPCLLDLFGKLCIVNFCAE